MLTSSGLALGFWYDLLGFSQNWRLLDEMGALARSLLGISEGLLSRKCSIDACRGRTALRSPGTHIVGPWVTDNIQL